MTSEYKKISTMLRNNDNLHKSIKQVREKFLSSPIFEKKLSGSSSFLSIFSQAIDQQYDSQMNAPIQHELEDKKFIKLNYSTDSSDESAHILDKVQFNKRNDLENLTPATTASSTFYQSGFSNFHITTDCFKNKTKVNTPLKKNATPFTPHFYTPKISKLKFLLALDSIPENPVYTKKFTENIRDSWKERIKFFRFKSFLKLVILLKLKYKKENNRTGNLILSYISRHSAEIQKQLLSEIKFKFPVSIFQ